ncbi:hypothetical protein ACLB1O_14460 [Escherichia coli]
MLDVLQNSCKRWLSRFLINACGLPSSAIRPLSIKISREATFSAKPISPGHDHHRHPFFSQILA